MRKASLTCCLVLAACAGMLAPHVHAGDDRTTVRLTDQWRIFPHAPFRRPADQEITARLARQIDPLVAVFQTEGKNVPLETFTDSLIDAKVRNQLFRLESLLRLYVRAFPDLEKYRVEVKKIEDGLGEYTFGLDSLKFARERFEKENQTRAPSAARKAEQENILASLEKKKESARAGFAKLVDRSTLASDLPELQSVVSDSLAGWGSAKDRGYVTGELQRVLRQVRDGRFNFTLLEDGIHEFRRRLRWFPILIDSLDGLVLLRDDAPGACPVPALEPLKGSPTARHRYSNPELKFPATNPCTISRCLLWQVVKTTNDIGRLKDDVQGNAAIESALDYDVDIASGNRVTPEEISRANAFRTELYSSRALDALMTQLSSCKS